MKAKTLSLAAISLIAMACVAPLPAWAHVVRVEFENKSTICVNVSASAWAITGQTKPVGMRENVKPGGHATFTADLIFTGSTSGGGTPPPVGKGVTVWTYGTTDCSGNSTSVLNTSRVLNPNKPDPAFQLTGKPGAFHIQ
jgi:hypothetical protein